ncbi:hypothetical protein F5148DRAFT_1152423 [Russula earlei]|uniref:Uncharacterized protein n=1 Tax=Russula earlei TaxID=71964 RepID=A0ACC0TXU4_9AGAM|nr:hypothetical protein F5148DRAFT_1152423 [Russula earlei]
MSEAKEILVHRCSGFMSMSWSLFGRSGQKTYHHKPLTWTWRYNERLHIITHLSHCIPCRRWQEHHLTATMDDEEKSEEEKSLDSAYQACDHAASRPFQGRIDRLKQEWDDFLKELMLLRQELRNARTKLKESLDVRNELQHALVDHAINQPCKTVGCTPTSPSCSSGQHKRLHLMTIAHQDSLTPLCHAEQDVIAIDCESEQDVLLFMTMSIRSMVDTVLVDLL